MAIGTCPGCSWEGDSQILIIHQKGYEIQRCASCRLVFTHPMPNSQQLENFYRGFEFGKPSQRSIEKHTEIIRKNVLRIIKDLKVAGCHFESALDFGGGLGYYSNAFAEHFEIVDLYDPDPISTTYAAEIFPGRFGVNTIRPGEQIEFIRQYDLVFANQVIEHFTNLQEFFSALLAASSDRTVFVITTPNNDSGNIWARPGMLAHYLWSTRSTGAIGLAKGAYQLATNSWACCDPPRHTFAFNPENLTTIAALNGISTISTATSYCIDDYYSPSKYQVIPAKDMKSIIRNIANAVIRIVLTMLKHADKRRARGDDIVLIGKRSERA